MLLPGTGEYSSISSIMKCPHGTWEKLWASFSVCHCTSLLGLHRRILRLGWLKQQKYILTLLEAKSPRSRFHPAWGEWGFLPGLQVAAFWPCLPMSLSLCTLRDRKLSAPRLLVRMPALSDQSSTLIISLSLNYLPHSPRSKLSHTGASKINFGRPQFSSWQ